MVTRDAAAAFDGIVKAKHVSPAVRTGLAAALSGSDGGRAWFAAVAIQEGLLPPGSESEASRMEFTARVPGVPENAVARARKWLGRPAGGGRGPRSALAPNSPAT